MIAAAGYALTQLIDLAPLSQPPGKPQLGRVVPGVGQRRMTSMASSVLAGSDSQLAGCRLACSSPAAARSPTSPTWSLLLAQGDLNHYVSFRPDESPLETAGRASDGYRGRVDRRSGWAA
jgi:hypothetical protein